MSATDHPAIAYRNGVLHVENVSCESVVESYGSPVYVYSRAAIEDTWKQFDAALSGRKHLICYAVKANSNLAVLSILARLGSGFDIVSVGELERVLEAGGEPANIVFSGVGKTRDELVRALEVGIRCFNLESASELSLLADTAESLNAVAPVSLRINPDVDANTHPYISTGLKDNKFGVPMDQAISIYQAAAAHPHIEVQGIDCHIGSQLTDPAPYRDATERLLSLVDELATLGITIQHIDVGGGQGIRYRDEELIDLQHWADELYGSLGDRSLEVMVEPGRFIVGNAGILLTRAQFLKSNDDKHFCIVDAAMNDLIRPALYSAWQDIQPVVVKNEISPQSYDVVGPVCESADFLGKDRSLAVEEGDLLAVFSAGAYAFVMSSNYNTRGRAAEVVIDDTRMHLARQRETVKELFALERVLPNDA